MEVKPKVERERESQSTMEQEIAALYDRLLRQAKFYYPRSTDDAYDLCNDTMVKMLTNQDKFQEGTNLYGWACMIMRNLFINDYRRTSRQGFVMEGSEEEGTK